MCLHFKEFIVLKEANIKLNAEKLFAEKRVLVVDHAFCFMFTNSMYSLYVDLIVQL